MSSKKKKKKGNSILFYVISRLTPILPANKGHVGPSSKLLQQTQPNVNLLNINSLDLWPFIIFTSAVGEEAVCLDQDLLFFKIYS